MRPTASRLHFCSVLGAGLRHIAGVTLSDRIKLQARTLGFDAVGVASAGDAWPETARLAEFLDAGRHGDMDWMAEDRRAHPQALWPEARSAVIVGQSYAPTD